MLTNFILILAFAGIYFGKLLFLQLKVNRTPVLLSQC